MSAKNRTENEYHIEYINDSHVRLTKIGEEMKIEKSSIVLAYIGWGSVFTESWLLIMRIVPADALSWSFFGMFFFVAVMASAVYSSKPKIKPITDVRVKIGDKIFAEDKGNLTIVRAPTGDAVICVIQPKDAALK